MTSMGWKLDVLTCSQGVALLTIDETLRASQVLSSLGVMNLSAEVQFPSAATALALREP